MADDEDYYADQEIQDPPPEPPESPEPPEPPMRTGYARQVPEPAPEPPPPPSDDDRDYGPDVKLPEQTAQAGPLTAYEPPEEKLTPYYAPDEQLTPYYHPDEARPPRLTPYYEPKQGSVGEGLDVLRRSLTESVISGVGAGSKYIATLPDANKNPYDQLPPSKLEAQANPPTPRDQDTAAFDWERASRPYQKAIESRRRQQEINRLTTQKEIDERPPTPPVQQRDSYLLGERIQQWARENFPVSDQERATYPIYSGTGSAIGGTVVPILTGVAFTALGQPTLGLLAAGTIMGAQSGGAEFDRAKAAIEERINDAKRAGDLETARKLEATIDDDAARAAHLSAGVNGVLGLLPANMILAPAKTMAPGIVGRLWGMLDHAWKSGVVFSGVGEVQHFLGEQLAKLYDPNAKYEFDFNRVVSSFLGGGVIGAATARRPPPKPAEPPPPAASPPADAAPPAQGVLPFPTAPGGRQPYDPNPPATRTPLGAGPVPPVPGQPPPTIGGSGERQLGLPLGEPQALPQGRPYRPGDQYDAGDQPFVAGQGPYGRWTGPPAEAGEVPPPAPPPPPRGQQELPLGAGPTVSREGQLGFDLPQPRGRDTSLTSGLPLTGGPTEMPRTSRPMTPDAGGTAKEAAPPIDWPAGTPNVTPHTAVERGVAAQEQRGVSGEHGINVLQPGQVDPAISHVVNERNVREAAARPQPAEPPPRTTFEPPRLPEQGPPAPPSGEIIPRGRALVPRVSDTTQGVMTESPVGRGMTRLYRNPAWAPREFTTDRARAGAGAHYVDVTGAEARGFTPGQAGLPDVTANRLWESPRYQQRIRPIRPIQTEPVRPGAVPVAARPVGPPPTAPGPAGGTPRQPPPAAPRPSPPPAAGAPPGGRGYAMDGPRRVRISNEPPRRSQRNGEMYQLVIPETGPAYYAPVKRLQPAYEKPKATAPKATAPEAPTAGPVPLDRPTANRLLNQPRLLQTEAAKRGMTPEALKAEAQRIVSEATAPKPAEVKPAEVKPAETPTAAEPHEEKLITTKATPDVEPLKATTTGKPFVIKKTTRGDIVVPSLHSTTFSKALDKYGTRKGLLGPLTTFVRKALVNVVGDIKVHVVSKDIIARLGHDPHVVGYYDKQLNHIIINGKFFDSPLYMAHAIIHEGIHAVTSHAIIVNERLKNVINAIMRDVLRKHKKTDETEYGFTNEREFLAESQSNPDFQQLLRGHELRSETVKLLESYTGKSNAKSAWNGIVAAVRKLLGVPPSKMTALEAAMRTTEAAMKLNEKSRAEYLHYMGDIEPSKARAEERMTAREIPKEEIEKRPAGETIGDTLKRIIADERGGARVPKLAKPFKVKGIKSGEGEIFTGKSMAEAAAAAKQAGYRADQIFNPDGITRYKPEAAAPAAPAAAPAAAAGGAGKPPTGATPSGRSAPGVTPAPLGGIAVSGPSHFQGIKDALNKWSTAYKNTFDPARISENALKGEAPARGSRAFLAGEQTRITRDGYEHEKMWDKQTPEDAKKYLSDIEHGRPVDPKFEAYAKQFKGELEKAYKEEKTLGSQADYIEHYAPHEWERPKPNQAPIKAFFESMGAGWFQKARIIDYIEAGEKAGYKLKYSNPELLLRSRLLAGANFRAKMELLHTWREMGLAGHSPDAANAKTLQRMGWQEMLGPDRRKWWIAPDVTQIWENGIKSQGYWADPGIIGDGFKAWMAFKMVWVPIKLAFSAFHPIHVVHINMSHNLARGMQQMAAGDVAGALGSMSQAVGPGLLYSGKGKMGRAEWLLGENARSEAGREAVRTMEEGGFVPMMNEEMRIDAQRSLEKAFKDMNPFKATVHGVRRIIQLLQSPIFEHWIPHLKTGAYLNDAAALLARRPELLTDDVQRKVALNAIAKGIDDRFGEMFYGGLFWNRKIKDANIAAWLSLGWNLGFGRQFIGAGIEAVSRPARGLIPGLEPHPTRKTVYEATNKITFATTYLTSAAVLGGLMTLLFAKHMPEDLNDLIFPWIGGYNPDGSKRRVTTMYYLREIPMLVKHVQEYGGGFSSPGEIMGTVKGTGAMIWNKLMFQPFVELATNTSYYGKEIWDSTADGFTQFKQAAEHFLYEQAHPMAATGARRAEERLGIDPQWYPTTTEGVLSYMGFGPAPSYAEKSAIQNRIAHLYKEHVAPGSRPYEEEANTHAKLRARSDILLAQQQGNEDKLIQAITNAREAGLTAKYVEETLQGVSGDQKMFKQLQDVYQTHLLNSASKKEVERYLPHAHVKVRQKWYQDHPPAEVSP